MGTAVTFYQHLELLNDDYPKTKQAAEIAKTSSAKRDDHDVAQPLATAPVPLAGSSMDMTLFAASRAAETIIHRIWLSRKKSRLAHGKWTSLEGVVSQYADSWVFAASAGAIMWAWFYQPNSLPQAYNAWIKSAAQVDQRLVEVLRRARRGEFVYGENTGQAPLLQSMCKDYDWPLVWGDPAKTVPLPCEMVHMGAGPSCHWHAITRFFKAFRFALAMYLPLQLLLRIRHASLSQLRKACREAARSSAFLGAFVSLFYYGVCLSRTRLGPKLVSKEIVTPLMWDSGLCVRAGCILCGWSILIEAERRRQELAMYYTMSIILGTVALSYGSVPMYKMICQQTGWGGQPIKASIHSTAEDPADRLKPVTSSRRLRITFNGSVSDIMPWKFTSQQREVRVLPGETALAFYTATNKSEEDIIGVATYSVTPAQVAPYFSKIQCFCFEEQRLNAGETVDMPVFFFIDPDFCNDPAMNRIDTITLSYTFFKARYDKNGHLTPMPL
ncbi:MAG: hypothetical protein Q9195_000649 [Heterodermia aff. obscurata]